MALIILEGIDRTGKSSVAEFYRLNGYELIHMSAPPKGISSEEYFSEMVELLYSFYDKDVVLDRSHYGELIWPIVYDREPLLSDKQILSLREIEQNLNPYRVLMHDPNIEAHWARCLDNNEPLSKVQFTKARKLYYSMAEKYDFVKKTLNDFPSATKAVEEQFHITTSEPVSPKMAHQIKLEKANAINEVLEKRILKGKGPVFDELEESVRFFLTNELESLFGNTINTYSSFSKEEVSLLKFFCERLKQKGDM